MKSITRAMRLTNIDSSYGGFSCSDFFHQLITTRDTELTGFPSAYYFVSIVILITDFYCMKAIQIGRLVYTLELATIIAFVFFLFCSSLGKFPTIFKMVYNSLGKLYFHWVARFLHRPCQRTLSLQQVYIEE